MHQSPFKAYSAIVIANGLFYGLVSRHAANDLDNCSNPSEKGQDNSWAGVVVLGTSTALFNLGISKLTQYQLSRVALLAITALVVL